MEDIFEKYESEVRSYCRKYPVIFERAVNDTIYSESGDAYIDFLSVAGSMNYGHNNPYIKSAVLEYLSEDRIINSLDMYTKAKERFIQTFEEEILIPRKLDYKIMCCGQRVQTRSKPLLSWPGKIRDGKTALLFPAPSTA